MAVYDRRHMDRMRREAIVRSQEMYSDPMPQPEKKEIPAAEIKNSGRREQDKVRRIFDELLGGPIDSDKLLIGALMLLLLREGADKKLILALGYILL